MENNFRYNVRVITPEELGMTQDEYNNWLIDIFEATNSEEFPVTMITVGEPVTITLTPQCHANYLDLDEQNN